MNMDYRYKELKQEVERNASEGLYADILWCLEPKTKWQRLLRFQWFLQVNLGEQYQSGDE